MSACSHPRRTFRAPLVALAALLGLALLAPERASAQGGLYLGVGLGPAIRIDDWPTQVRIEQEIGYYIEGRPEGFFIGFAPSQSFGDDYWLITFAPRLGYMFGIFQSRDVTFQLGPAGTIPGIAIGNFFDPGPRDADAYFHFSFSLMMRILFARNRAAFYLRPVEFEFGFGDSSGPYNDDDGIRYVLEGGFQFHL